MGRQVINEIKCAVCGNSFDVATEDLEWEHIEDFGERDDNPVLHDLGIGQSVVCPHCNKPNKILYKAIGESISGPFFNEEVLSMELGAIISQ